MPPKTRYATTPEGHVAYQILGNGPGEIVFVPDHASNLEIMWEEPSLARFLTRLSSIGRLICFDKRGTGVSDPVPLGALPTLEQWMDDIRTVVDAAGSERVTVFGHGDGGLMAILFAATYPERTSALILADAFARMMRAADYPCGMPSDVARACYETICARWGSGTLNNPAPSMKNNPSFREWRGRFERLSLSPGALAAIYPVIVLQSDVVPFYKPFGSRRSFFTGPETVTFGSGTDAIWRSRSPVPSMSSLPARTIISISAPATRSSQPSRNS